MEMSIVLLNFAYALVGSLIALSVMGFGYRLFDFFTPFDTNTELQKGNVAVGLVIAGKFVGIGIAVGMVIGMGLN